jgi:hypothetical protein
MGRLYRDVIIPLTKEVEVDYLMKRIWLATSRLWVFPFCLMAASYWPRRVQSGLGVCVLANSVHVSEDECNLQCSYVCVCIRVTCGVTCGENRKIRHSSSTRRFAVSQWGVHYSSFLIFWRISRDLNSMNCYAHQSVCVCGWGGVVELVVV